MLLLELSSCDCSADLPPMDVPNSEEDVGGTISLCKSLKMSAFIATFNTFSAEDQAEILASINIIMMGITPISVANLPASIQATARFGLFLAGHNLTIESFSVVMSKYNRIKDLCCGGLFSIWNTLDRRSETNIGYLYPTKDLNAMPLSCAFSSIGDITSVGVAEGLYAPTIITKEEFFSRLLNKYTNRVAYLCKSIAMTPRSYVTVEDNYVCIVDVVRSPDMDQMLKDIGWL